MRGLGVRGRARPAAVLVGILLTVGCGATEEPTRSLDVDTEVVKLRQVIDGDTVELSDGRDVRLIGIDTPERDTCGYEQARSLLTRLLLERPVRVTITEAPGQDRDRYDRLLRYVEADGADVADTLLDSGWARARYDSRDGYPEHPREDVYRAADEGSVSRGC